jgi:tRNA threonylcarbamoyladenosine dehydratase
VETLLGFVVGRPRSGFWRMSRRQTCYIRFSDLLNASESALMLSLVQWHSHRTQLVLTALTASITTATLISLYTTYSRRERRHKLDEEVQQSIASHPPRDPSSSNDDIRLSKTLSSLNESVTYSGYDEDLIREQLARNYAFFGDGGMAKIRGGSVVIVGCGGVGSWAAVMLVRS